MNIAVAIDSVPQDALPSASEAGPAPKRIVVAYGFWIFLLERHRHVCRALCELRGSRALHGRRSDRRPVVQSDARSRSKPLAFSSRATPAD